MQKEKQLVPQLRFPEFDGEWKNRSLKEILTIGSGKDYKHLENGEIPVYGSGGLMTYVNDYLYDGNSIGIGRKGTIDKPVFLTGKFWTVDTLFYTHSFRKLDIKFIYNQFQRVNWKKYNEAGGVPSLSKKTIEQIQIKSPSLEEQQKIANFLTSVDERIQTLEKKKTLLEQYKKGLLQKIFKQELRFKDDNGEEFPEWEKYKLSDISERIKTKNKVDNQNVLTISAQLGLVSQLEYFNKSVSAKNLTGYYLLEKNDFAYNKSYSKGYPMGAIKRLNKYDLGVVSTLYICFRFNAKVSLDFMEQYFEAGLQNKEIEKVAQEGARNHGLLNIGVNDFFEIDLKLPSLKEQTKIAIFLSAIDENIALVNNKIEHTKSYKKGLLQQMFV